MSALLLYDSIPLPEGLGISAEDWHQPPTSVRCQLFSLLKRVEPLAARFHQDSSNSSRPPSTDTPAKKRARRTHAATRCTPGATRGHPRQPQGLLEPTATVSLLPEACACGQRGCAEGTWYRTHQVMEFPIIRSDVSHRRLHQGRCRSCGTLGTASLPAEHTSGYGLRSTGCVGARAGMVGVRRSAGQDLYASVFSMAQSTGAIQKLVVDRVSVAIGPHDTAIGVVARTSVVHDIDETSWLLHRNRQWL